MERSALNSRNVKEGKAGQLIAMQTLKSRGFSQVWPIATPCKPIYGPKDAKGERKLEKIVYEEKAPGDIWCAFPGSRILTLVEVKAISGDRLPWSRLEAHQPLNLSQAHKDGCKAFLAVVRQDVAHLLPWEFAHGTTWAAGLNFKKGTALVYTRDGWKVE